MRVKFGDVIEIKTSKGLAYALYTHRHDKPPRYGELIRVFDKLFPDRPADLQSLSELPIRFSTFFPLQPAVSGNLVKIVGTVPIPEILKPFPLFRSGTVNPQTKKVDVWWLWDGEKSWQVGAITPEQRYLPIESIWTYPYLVHRIEEGWRPENDPR